tara:strand:- start:962 stop:1450 length:489 start_codon:yes stop_codon:yes gene_type:complete
MLRKIILGGCLCTASFYLACTQQVQSGEQSNSSGTKELKMYQESELALLMRTMYDNNMELRQEIMEGKIPENFPERFYTIHTATISNGMSREKGPFEALADQYLNNMKAITRASSPREAKIAYNEMVMSCAGCHQIYCPGPLVKIRKMRIPLDETTDSNHGR